MGLTLDSIFLDCVVCHLTIHSDGHAGSLEVTSGQL